MIKLRFLPVSRMEAASLRPRKAYSINFWRRAVLLSLLPLPGLAANPLHGLSDTELREARWYQVELIVFAHANPAAGENEHWQTREGLRLPDNTTFLTYPQDTLAVSAAGSPSTPSLTAPAVQTSLPVAPIPAVNAAGNLPPLPPAYEILPESDWQLAAADAKLRKSTRYEMLLHVAWRQPTFDRGQGIPVMLYAGMDSVPETPAPSDSAAAGTQSPPSATDALIRSLQSQLTPARPATAADAEVGEMNPRLVGTVELSVARYLHLKTDLFYRQMTLQKHVERVSDNLLWFDTPYPTLRALQGPAYQLRTWYAMRGFELEESRRMRSSEIHYLDHPLFGVVALITPYEIAKPIIDNSDVKVLPPPPSLNR